MDKETEEVVPEIIAYAAKAKGSKQVVHLFSSGAEMIYNLLFLYEQMNGRSGSLAA